MISNSYLTSYSYKKLPLTKNAPSGLAFGSRASMPASQMNNLEIDFQEKARDLISKSLRYRNGSQEIAENPNLRTSFLRSTQSAHLDRKRSFENYRTSLKSDPHFALYETAWKTYDKEVRGYFDRAGTSLEAFDPSTPGTGLVLNAQEFHEKQRKLRLAERTSQPTATNSGSQKRPDEIDKALAEQHQTRKNSLLKEELPRLKELRGKLSASLVPELKAYSEQIYKSAKADLAILDEVISEKEKKALKNRKKKERGKAKQAEQRTSLRASHPSSRPSSPIPAISAQDEKPSPFRQAAAKKGWADDSGDELPDLSEWTTK
jgi:hypothetical protein